MSLFEKLKKLCKETAAPEGYLLPVVPEKNYFYFCNDTFLIPTILADLPENRKLLLSALDGAATE